MTAFTQTQPAGLTHADALAIAAGAVKELIDTRYCFLDRYQSMFGEKLPAQARRDSERRALLLAVAAMLEAEVRE